MLDLARHSQSSPALLTHPYLSAPSGGGNSLFLGLQENLVGPQCGLSSTFNQQSGPSPNLMYPQIPGNPVEMQTQIQDPGGGLRFCTSHKLPGDSLLLVLGLYFD